MRILIFSLCFIFFLMNCQNDGSQTESPTRKTPKRSDPEVQNRCRGDGKNICKKDDDCEKICDNFFSDDEHETDCLELPEEMVLDFKQLFDDMENEEIDDIDAEVLECLLDIDDTEFVDNLDKMRRSSSIELLEDIMEDDSLSNILYKEDDEYLILKQFFHNIMVTRSNLEKILKYNGFEDDKTIVLIAGEQNKSAWNWLDNFITEVCGKNEDCYGDNDNIGAYCKALLNMTDDDLKNLLKDADNFKNAYRSHILSEGYKYEVGGSDKDFKAYCRKITAGRCPANNPPDNEKTASITFERGTNPSDYTSLFYYRHASYRYYNNCENRVDRGSTTPSQDIVLAMNTWYFSNGSPEVYLNGNSGKLGAYDSTKTYYIYIGGTRYELNRNQTFNCDSVPDHLMFNIKASDTTKFKNQIEASCQSNCTSLDVHVASEKNNVCTYYK